MTFIHAILLGLLQGITEFLPISSSGHLVIFESIFGLHVGDLKDFDVMLHLGTLLAILIYFWKDIWNVKAWPLLIAASVPAALIGFLFEDQIDSLFRGILPVSIVMVVVGILFLIPAPRVQKPLTWTRGIAIGIAQAFALIPGVSRSGSTIFMGTMLGLNRQKAAEFSFLLGAIAITGAGLLKTIEVKVPSLDYGILFAGFFASFISGMIAISFFMNFLKNHSLKLFGSYRIIFGLGIMLLLATNWL